MSVSERKKGGNVPMKRLARICLIGKAQVVVVALGIYFTAGAASEVAPRAPESGLLCSGQCPHEFSRRAEQCRVNTAQFMIDSGSARPAHGDGVKPVECIENRGPETFARFMAALQPVPAARANVTDDSADDGRQYRNHDRASECVSAHEVATIVYSAIGTLIAAIFGMKIGECLAAGGGIRSLFSDLTYHVREYFWPTPKPDYKKEMERSLADFEASCAAERERARIKK